MAKKKTEKPQASDDLVLVKRQILAKIAKEIAQMAAMEGGKDGYSKDPGGGTYVKNQFGKGDDPPGHYDKT